MKVNIAITHSKNYPTYYGLRYFYSIGSLLGLIFTIQLISGIILVSNFENNPEGAFDSIDNITNNIKGGYIWRFLHMNIASIIFMLLFLHIGKYIYFKLNRGGNNQGGLAFKTGYTILLLFIVVSFLGYVLPYGQMSFRGATVITNLIATVPYGGRLLQLIWGDVLVGDSTLKRFFMAHFILPFIILVIVIIHIYTIHMNSSGEKINKFTINKNLKISLMHNLIIKDIFCFLLIIIILLAIIIKDPYIFANPVNEIKGNNLVTPEHILPEWYFLSFYCILKFIPSKIEGIIYMVLYIVSILFLINNTNINKKSIFFLKIFTSIFYFFSISACDTILNTDIHCFMLLILIFNIILFNNSIYLKIKHIFLQHYIYIFK